MPTKSYSMISVSDLWSAIDEFALHHDISLVDVAVDAGLPPLALTPENRRTKDGQLRWPALEVVLQLVKSAGVSLKDFAVLVDRIGAMRARERDGACETRAPRPRAVSH